MNSNNTQNNPERALVETGVIIKLGLDVHAAKVVICVQIDGATPRPSQMVPSERVMGWISALRARYPGARVVSCYEAGAYRLRPAQEAPGQLASRTWS